MNYHFINFFITIKVLLIFRKFNVLNLMSKRFQETFQFCLKL